MTASTVTFLMFVRQDLTNFGNTYPSDRVQLPLTVQR